MIFIYLHLLPLPLPLIYYLHYLHKKKTTLKIPPSSSSSSSSPTPHSPLLLPIGIWYFLQNILKHTFSKEINQYILNSFLRDRLWDTRLQKHSNAFWTPSLRTIFEIHFEIFLPCSFLGGDRRLPLLLALHLCLDFTSEMNESLIKDAFFKPCFDTQLMAFPSELSYSPATPYHPSPWPSTTQHLFQHLSLHLCLHLHLLFHQNNPSTMQYNWLESETQCALMHSVLNSLRNHLWFNWLKDTETWSWNIMLQITYLSSSLSSLYTTLLTSPPPPSPPLLPSPL